MGSCGVWVGWLCWLGGLGSCVAECGCWWWCECGGWVFCVKSMCEGEIVSVRGCEDVEEYLYDTCV